MNQQAMELMELVAKLDSEHEVNGDLLRAELAALLPSTPLSGARCRLCEIELKTGHKGLEALWRVKLLAPVSLSDPGPPRWPITDEDLTLAARLMSEDAIPDDDIRAALAAHLATSPLGPAVWRVRDIEWALATPPITAAPPTGIDAVDVWRASGELVDELLALPAAERRAAAESERYRSTVVVHQLLDRAAAVRFADVGHHLELAELAAVTSTAVLAAGQRKWIRYRGLHALSLITSANAWRMSGDFAEARARLRRSKASIAGERDPRIRGRYYGTLAAVLIFAREIDDAREASAMSIAAYQEAGDRHLVGKALMQMSYIDSAAGVLSEDSLLRLRRAADLTDPMRDPTQRDTVFLNLAGYQAQMGNGEKALQTWRMVETIADIGMESQRKAVLATICLTLEQWGEALCVLDDVITHLESLEHCDSYYYRLIRAQALLRIGDARSAAEDAHIAAIFFGQASVLSIATAANQVQTEAAAGSISTAAIACLLASIEPYPYGSTKPPKRTPKCMEHLQ